MKSPARSLAQHLQSGAVLAVGLISAGSFLFGCGTHDAVEPNEPTFDDGQFVTIENGQTTKDVGPARAETTGNRGSGKVPGQVPSHGGDNGDGIPDAIDIAVVASEQVDSKDSATIVNGRYSMIIPSGALPGTTEYKITQQPGDSQVKCVLEPHSLLFDEPVVVQFDLSGTDAVNHPNIRAQWFDEGTQQWFDVPSSWDPTTEILTGYFPHFCYGRAGW